MNTTRENDGVDTNPHTEKSVAECIWITQTTNLLPFGPPDTARDLRDQNRCAEWLQQLDATVRADADVVHAQKFTIFLHDFFELR